MKKIPSLYQRNYETDRLVRDEIVDGCEWVLEGEGVPTVKRDGTSCMVQDGVLYKRYEVKKGRTPPEDFIPADDVNPVTGKQTGWRPVGDGPEDKYHREAFEDGMPDGTYELLGPKVQGNPEGLDRHVLEPHGSIPLDANPRTFDEIRDYLKDADIEGIVWWHPDGRKAKIKKRDFGYKRSTGV